MTPPVFELCKVAAFGAMTGLLASYWLDTQTAALIAATTFWLLLARIT